MGGAWPGPLLAHRSIRWPEAGRGSPSRSPTSTGTGGSMELVLHRRRVVVRWLNGAGARPIFRQGYAPADRRSCRLEGWAVADLDCVHGGHPSSVCPRPLMVSRSGRRDRRTLTNSSRSSLTGRHDSASGPPPMRSNAIRHRHAPRTPVSVRPGSRDEHSFAIRRSPGQSLQPLALGTAGHDRIDFIALNWSDAVSSRPRSTATTG